MHKVFIMSGVSGSGKSTYARELIDMAGRLGEIHDTIADTLIVSADDYFMFNGVYEFKPAFIADAHNACFRSFIAAVSPGVPKHQLVIVDNTNLTSEEIAPYMLAAQAYGWEAEIITLRTPHTTERRLALGVLAARNIHGVGESSLASQKKRLDNRKLLPWWKSTDIKVIL